MNASASVRRQSNKIHWYWAIPQTKVQGLANNRFGKGQSSSYLRSVVKRKMQLGHLGSAIAILTCIINRHPQSASDYNNRGLAYFQMGKLHKALADYNKAIALNPKLDSAYNNRANFYATQKMWCEALDDYDMALSLNPTNVRAWINQGITFRQLGLYEQSVDNFEIALNFERLQGMSYAQRGRSYHLRGDWNCALADYRRAFTHLQASSKTESQLLQKVESWHDELVDFALSAA